MLRMHHRSLQMFQMFRPLADRRMRVLIDAEADWQWQHQLLRNFGFCYPVGANASRSTVFDEHPVTVHVQCRRR